MNKFYGGIVSMLVLCSLACALVQGSGSGPQVGKTAPPLKVSGWVNTKDKELSLEKLKGKVVVLDFWAYW